MPSLVASHAAGLPSPPPIRKVRSASQTDVLSVGDSGCWDSACMRPRFGSRCAARVLANRCPDFSPVFVAGQRASRMHPGLICKTFARTRPCRDNPLRRRSKSAIRWGGGFGCLCPRRPEATTSVTNHAELLKCCVQEQRRGGHVVVTVGRHA